MQDEGDRYLTERGQVRLRRLRPGLLAKRIREVCKQWVRGEIESVDDSYISASEIRRAVEAEYERPVSYYGVQFNLQKMQEMGYAEVCEGPWGFKAFTRASVEVGYGPLEAEWKERRAAGKKQAEKADAAPVHYRPVEDDGDDWTDVETYVVET